MSALPPESTSLQSLVGQRDPREPRNDYQNPFAKRLFLVIDSVPEMQRALAMTLASFGAEKVEYASKAADALAKMSRFEFDVVL